MKGIKIVCALFILVVFCSECRAQESKLAIEVAELTGEGSVGQRLLYHIKEAIRRSAQFRLSYGKEVRIRLLVNTMPMWENNPNAATIYSVVWVMTDATSSVDYYLNSTLGYCGSNVVEQAAEGVVARTDQLLATITKLWQK